MALSLRLPVATTRCLGVIAGGLNLRPMSSFTTPPPPPTRRKTYRDPNPLPAPKPVRVREASLMGELDEEAMIAGAAPRPVPTSSKEFVANRRAYKKAMKQFRLKFKAEWDGRRAREAEAVRLYREKLDAAKAKLAEYKATRRTRNLATHARQMELDHTARRLRKELNQASRAAFFEQVAGKRREWLDALEVDAESWIPEDKIDEMITAETFSMKHPWQYEVWYAQKERQQRSASAKSGEGFLSVKTIDDEEYDDLWDSDVEEEIDSDEWSPLRYMERTGLQLDELYHAKRAPELVQQFIEWRDEYIEKHYPKEDWAELKSFGDASRSRVPGEEGGRSRAMEALGGAGDVASQSELDEIYDMLTKK